MKFVLVTVILSAATAEVNSKQTSWTAGRNFPEDIPTEVLKRRLTGTFPPNRSNAPTKFHRIDAAAIPGSFDGREYWPQCESIGEIRNQGSCGSCWAFASCETMTDRICIASNGTQKFKFSPEHLLTCCPECGSCGGGYMDKALSFYVRNGVVSGGDFGSNEGCQPYDIDAYRNGLTPACVNYCVNPSYEVSYEEDKHYGSSYYHVSGKDVRQIQTEIMINGPVETYMDVYDEFFNYSSGVYACTSGENPGGHAVKIIGWGTEDGTPYWLVANSWGGNWAALGGFFKIIRGQNNCRIEEWVYATEPKLETHRSL